MPTTKKKPANSNSTDTPPPHTIISNNTFSVHADAHTLTPEMANALTQVAIAAAENAKALLACAKALTGPSHNFGPALAVNTQSELH